MNNVDIPAINEGNVAAVTKDMEEDKDDFDEGNDEDNDDDDGVIEEEELRLVQEEDQRAKHSSCTLDRDAQVVGIVS
ncbi:hypothetical protein AMTR_s00031p00059180 [Amborella trichopoda]|uniref:Uncharacterized protein n=1 Tax=Amborella trichopoda TaxID=13333 RepID=U5D260_AMBTC|nr:hypothetical protein AMTR_s00031p00059180 [Amborella trichopoda]